MEHVHLFYDPSISFSCCSCCDHLSSPLLLTVATSALRDALGDRVVEGRLASLKHLEKAEYIKSYKQDSADQDIPSLQKNAWPSV